MAVLLVLIAFLLKKLMDGGKLDKTVSLIISIMIIFLGLSNIVNFFINDFKKTNEDPSLYRNEIAAIDYVYQKAGDRNFKVYDYLPSIIDYPYQYLIWWYGLKKYGYLPADYAYAPNRTPYISNKESFSATSESLQNRQDSDLVFLIKEPNRNNTRSGWEGNFIKMESIEKQKLGSLEVEIRKEIIQ